MTGLAAPWRLMWQSGCGAILMWCCGGGQCGYSIRLNGMTDKNSIITFIVRVYFCVMKIFHTLSLSQPNINGTSGK